MGKNILTYEEFLNDCDFIDESNKISSLELIELLMEEERENGYYFDLDECDEGWSFGSRGRGSDRTFKFTPGKNDTDVTSTEIFNEDKKFKYHEVLLPKSGVMSYNLYKISDMRISKALKHPNKFKDIEKREIDFDSIDKFMKRSSLYIYSILKNNPVDIITYPESSSEFNKEMVEYIMDRYKKSPGIKCIPNLMSKNIRNVYVNFTVAKELGLSDEDINRLRHDVENWKSDADVYDLRVKIDELNDYIAYHSGKRGRPTNDIKQKKELVKNLEEQIKILRKGRRGKDKTKSSDGKAKNFEIKSIEDKRRRSLEGLFGINPKLSGIQQDLKGKHIVIFDDNISSGATLDDICLELQKYGVASILPITLAIIPKTVYGQEHESLKNR
jgi:hypoxanthine phosphoribosyltransferase